MSPSATRASGRIVMVKKRLAGGETCRKCAEAEATLRKRGLWEKIDEVLWAEESDPSSAGLKLAAEHGVERTPFFLVHGPKGAVTVYTSVLRLIRERLGPGAEDVPAASSRPDRPDLAGVEPAEVVRWALERFGADCGLAFSGAEDVALVHMAAQTGLPFSVFALDTGRLHPETYAFYETVRKRYGVPLRLITPDPKELEPFVEEKGLFSFYEDGHRECCGLRKVAPLARALAGLRAWITGQRQDQSPATRAAIPVLQDDPAFVGKGREPLLKLNPLARWSSAQVWAFIRAEGIPYNPLHERGYISIGCEPCTRPVHPGQHEREGRWWWEDATRKECGLHLSGARGEDPSRALPLAEDSGGDPSRALPLAEDSGEDPSR